MVWAEYLRCQTPSLEFDEGAVGDEVGKGVSGVTGLVQRHVADISQEGRQEQRIAEIGEEGEYTKGREFPGVKGPQRVAVVAILYAVEDVDKVIDVRQDSDSHGPNGASEAARKDDMDYRPQGLTSSQRKSGSKALGSCDRQWACGPTTLRKNDTTYFVRVVEHVVRLLLFQGPLLTVV